MAFRFRGIGEFQREDRSVASYIERLILADADKASTAKKQYLFVLRQKNDAVRHSRRLNQSAHGLLLTNIVLANILATECMIRMWWTGNLAVLRSYMKWAVGTDTTCRPACTVASKFLSGEYSA